MNSILTSFNGKVKNIAKSIKSKLNLNKLYSILIFSLMFLYGLDFLSVSSVFLVLLIVVFSIKMIFTGEIVTSPYFFIIAIFGISYFALDAFNFGFKINHFIQYCIAPVVFYEMGLNIYKTYKDKNKALFNMIFAFLLGFTMHGLLNMVARVFGFGLLGNARAAIDIWTGEIVVSTGVGSILSPLASLFFPIVFIRFNGKRWYHVLGIIFIFVATLWSALSLSNRGELVILILGPMIGLLYVLISDKKQRRKVLIVLGIVLVGIIGAVVAYKMNLFGIEKILAKIPIVQRILKNPMSFFDTPRLKIYSDFLKQFLNFPLGGKKITLPAGEGYCHNVWLDIYYTVGAIPAGLFLIITFAFVKRIITICILGKDTFIKVVTVCLMSTMFLVFMIEPIMQSSIYLFLFIFVVFGMMDAMHKDLVGVFITRYRRPLPEDGKLKVAFVSNHLSIHQVTLCKELIRIYGENFTFVERQSHENRLISLDEHSYIIEQCAVNMSDNSEKAKQVIDDADILIYGSAPSKAILRQLKRGKVVFRYSERLYKTGKMYEYFSPRAIISQFRNYHRLSRYKLYYLCASAYTSYDLSRFGTSENRCYKWGYYSIDSQFESFEELFAQKNKTETTEILFINRLLDWKHPEKCIVVARHLKEKNIPFNMKIVGKGEEKMVSFLQNEILIAGLRDFVTLVGAVSNAEVLEMMKNANIVFASSDYGEGWGVCVNEGMSNGCVVVASHSHGSVPYLIEDKVNGIVYNFDDDKDMCRQVERICNDKMLQEEIGRNAFNTMKEKWNAKYAADKLSYVIDQIVHNLPIEIEDQSGPLGKAEVIKQNWFSRKKRKNVIANSVDKVNKTVESGSQIKKAAVVSYIAVFVNIITGLLYLPWMVKTIGEEKYGIYLIALSIISMIALDFGLGDAIAKFLAKFKAENDTRKASDFLGVIYKIFFILGFIIFVILLVIFIFIKTLYGKNLSAELLHQLKVVFVIVGSFSVFSFVCRPMDSIFVANEKFTAQKIINLIHRILIVVLVVVSLLLGGDLYAVVLANVVSGLVTIVMRYFYLKKNVNIKINFKKRDPEIVKTIFSFTVWVTITMLAQRLILNITPTILKNMSTDYELTRWGLGASIESYVFILSSTLNGLLLPKLSRMDASNATSEQYTKLLIRVGRIQMFVSCLLVGGFIALGRGFVTVWMKSPNYDVTYYVTMFLIIPSLVTNSLHTGLTLLVVKNKIKYQTISVVVSAVICLVANVLLSGPYGATGSAIGIMAGLLIGNVVLQSFFLSKQANIKMFSFYKSVHLKYILQFAVIVAIGLGIEYVIPTQGWMFFVIKGCMFVIVYGVITWFTAMNKEEKSIILPAIRQISNILDKVNEY